MKVSAIIRLCGGQTAVARKLEISQQMVYGWVKRGKIPDKHIPTMRKTFSDIVSGKVFDDLQGVTRESTQTPA